MSGLPVTLGQGWSRRACGAVLLALIASCLLVACDQNGSAKPQAAATFNGVDITGADYAHKLSLTDADG